MAERTDFKDHFSARPAAYAHHRPVYPGELIDFLAGLAHGHETAWDCACGTGQLSTLLPRRFDRVIATDASTAQIAAARPHPGVEYRVALAEDCGLADRSVDLITVAQAAHWLQLARFYDEVRRVARPRAGLALIAYGVLEVDPAIETVVQGFYYDAMGPYWPPERREVERGYRDLDFPFPEVQAPPMAITVAWTYADFMGYVDTWSSLRAAEQAGRADLHAEFAQALQRCWGDPQVRRTISWPLSVRAGNVAAAGA